MDTTNYNMDTANYTELMKRLWKHHNDYSQGKTQDFGQVCKDCLVAGDMLCTLRPSTVNTVALASGVQKEHKGTKLCEIKVTEGADSLKELVFQLTSNGYRVDVAPVYKEFPRTGLDYWMIAIFDKG
jgi:hypothetical protein